MELKQKTLAVRDAMFQVPLWRGGSGEALLYLHGPHGLGNDLRFLEMLAESFDVLAPSHPGWDGASGLEHLEDILDLALYYFDFLDELGIESARVVGHSLGGMLAAEMAALGGSYVRRLVLVDALGLWLDDTPAPDPFTMSAEQLRQASYFDPDRAPPESTPDPEDREAVARESLRRQLNLAAAGKFIWPIPDKGLKKRIHRVKAPTLIIWGERDGLLPLAYGRELQRLLRGSRLEIIPGTAHLPMLERPDEFVRRVRDFLTA